MAAVDATVSRKSFRAKAWEGFAEGNWQRRTLMSVTLFQKNYTPYGGRRVLSLLTPPRRPPVRYLDDNYLPWSASSASTTSTPTHRLARRIRRRLHRLSGSRQCGCRSADRRSLQARHDAGTAVGVWSSRPSRSRQGAGSGNQEDFHRHRKTHNDGVFGVYTKQIKAARHNRSSPACRMPTAVAASSAITVVVTWCEHPDQVQAATRTPCRTATTSPSRRSGTGSASARA